jgi:hypothetical protein
MIDICSAIADPNLFKPLFKDLSTWSNWLVALKTIFAIPFSDDHELKVYREFTGRTNPPSKPFKEIFLIIGRRGGKSFISSVIAVYLALFHDFSRFLSVGERAVVMVIANDRKQAGIVLRYIKGILASVPLFRSHIQNEKAEIIELTNQIDIQVSTCSYRTTRGFTVAACIFEEAGFWRVQGINIDKEIYTSVKPATTTIPNSLIIFISTPFSKMGLLFEGFKTYFATEDPETLVWKAPSIVMNPTLSEKMIEKELNKDLSAARAEWLSEFREDIEAFLPLEVIERVIIPGRIELPYVEKFEYQGFFDAAAGGADFFSLSVGHKEGEKTIQDQLKARKGNPYEIVREFSDLLKKYHCHELKGDKFAGSWVSEAFQKEGILYQASELNKSELYLESLAYFSAGLCELLDNAQLIKELRLLERRRGSSGKDTVDHPKSIGGGIPHDDMANVTCGMIAIAQKAQTTPGFFFAGGRSLAQKVSSGPTLNLSNIDRFFRGDDE